ncbi:PLP-dependent cysteine synthase family protein [Kalamiella sp. sgz302252]|uniref:PLP-dependent cysteine synthase family protein n=1 Tax=Pantoea sp. sgz302252 TaxID=3341827 RepID=UPI0036D41169
MSDPWIATAIAKLYDEQRRQVETPLISLPLTSSLWLYLKDESAQPSGSLKHRLARSLFLYALCNGWIKQGTPVIEASSGSTAISEAWFARLLGLPFFAVMPESTAKAKIKQIRLLGGECHFVKHAGELAAEAARLAKKLNGHFMDQFTFAERATDWRKENIAASLFQQLARTPFPVPTAIVAGAGTGNTATTIGRYLRYQGHTSRLLVVDPENSVFFDYWQRRDCNLRSDCGSKIEGIGRPCVAPSFIPDVVDEMIKVPDGASIAAMHWLTQKLGRKVGPSTGTNVWGALQVAKGMAQARRGGAIVTLLCDSGERYQDTYYHPDWVAEHIGDLRPWQQQLPVESDILLAATANHALPFC